MKIEENEFGSFARSMMSIDDYMRPYRIWCHKARRYIMDVDRPMVFQHYGKAMECIRKMMRNEYRMIYGEELGEKGEEWVNGFGAAFYMPVMVEEGEHEEE